MEVLVVIVTLVALLMQAAPPGPGQMPADSLAA